MPLKFYAEPCETTPGRWQVVGTKDGGRTFLLDSGLTKAAARRAVKLAERGCGDVLALGRALYHAVIQVTVAWPPDGNAGSWTPEVEMRGRGPPRWKCSP